MAVNVEETKAYVEELIKRSRIAQKKFEREYNTQRAIDEVVRAIGMACIKHQDDLAELGVAESHMGTVLEEKGKFLNIACRNWNFRRSRLLQAYRRHWLYHAQYKPHRHRHRQCHACH